MNYEKIQCIGPLTSSGVNTTSFFYTALTIYKGVLLILAE